MFCGENMSLFIPQSPLDGHLEGLQYFALRAILCSLHVCLLLTSWDDVLPWQVLPATGLLNRGVD